MHAISSEPRVVSPLPVATRMVRMVNSTARRGRPDFAETHPRVPPEWEIGRCQKSRARKLDAQLLRVRENKVIRDTALK